MAIFSVPARITRNLSTGDPIRVRNVAKTAIINASRAAVDLLKTEAEWAHTALTEELSSASAGKLLAALKRLEFAALEAARIRATKQKEFLDWINVIEPHLAEALQTELEIDAKQPDWQHRRNVVDGINALNVLERDMAKATGAKQPMSNHSKGKQHRRKA